jgi:hypothetical protein
LITIEGALRKRPHPADVGRLTVLDQAQTCTCRECQGRSGGVLVLVEDAAEAVSSVDTQVDKDRIRCAKDTGLRRLPSREFAINQWPGASPPRSPRT